MYTKLQAEAGGFAGFWGVPGHEDMVSTTANLFEEEPIEVEEQKSERPTMNQLGTQRRTDKPFRRRAL